MYQHIQPLCNIYTTSFFIGLPLSEDIEGPSTLDVDFIVGARPITAGTDFNFVGELTGLVIMPYEAPSGFSGCVLQCLETMTTNTTGTSIIANYFDRQQRQLVLFGPASPEVFQSVLRTVMYTNLAPDINVASIRVEVFDGSDSTVESITVIQGTMRKKRSVATTITSEPDHQQAKQLRHHLLDRRDESKNVAEKEISATSLNFHWPFVVVALSCVGILLGIVVVWGVRRKQQPKSWA